MALKKITLLFMLLALAGCAPRHASAQFIGYVSPQTVQQQLATSVACTGSAQTFPISSLGQTQHYLSIQVGGGPPQKVSAELDGIDKNGATYRISDILSTNNGIVYGAGYYAQLQASVTCSPGSATFSMSYSGGWGTSNNNSGAFLLGQVDKIFWSATAGANSPTATVATPFASSAGVFYFTFASSPGTGTLTFTCNNAGGVTQQVSTFSTVSTTLQQQFPIPSWACPTMTAAYSGAGAGPTIGEYVFYPPGAQPAMVNSYTHIAGTTATVVKGGPGFLHTVSINLGLVGTLSIFDLAPASCTGTPATNQIAIITATVATLQTFTYDVNLLNGICVKASVAMDVTVSSQ